MSTTMMSRLRRPMRIAASAAAVVLVGAALPHYAFADDTAQATLTVSNTVLGNNLSTVVTLTSAGGTGTGTVTYNVIGSGCTGTTTVTRSTFGTCSVTATKAGSTVGEITYTSTTSEPVIFSFGTAQAAVKVAAQVGTVAAGATYTLSATGGSGTGDFTYSAGTGCTISGATVTRASAGACSVTAVRAAQSPYRASAASAAVSITFLTAQSTLAISNDDSIIVPTGTAGLTVLTPAGGATNGGSGTGAVTANSATSGCTVKGAVVTRIVAGTCVVTATRAGSTVLSTAYASKTSASKTFTFKLPQTSALVISTSNTAWGTVGDDGYLTMATSGGSGDGVVTYATTGTNCSFDADHATHLIKSGADGGTCSVIATKAANDDYASATSAATIFTFGSAQPTLTLGYNATQFAAHYLTGTMASFYPSGGAGNGAVTYTLQSGTCTLKGTTVTAAAAGNCVVKVTRAADLVNYIKAATSVPVTFVFRAS